MAIMAVGAYQTACEASPHRQQIDIWFNEGKSCSEVSRLLKSEFNESISEVSVRKYKKYRDDFIQAEIEKSPDYIAKTKEIQEQFNDGIGKVQKIDVISKLADVIDDAADMLAEAKGNIRIKNAQDYKFVTSTLLDAVKLYGDTVLKAQKFGAVEKDPSLLRPTTVNVNVKATLKDILGSMVDKGGFELIDNLRNGMAQPEPTSDYEEVIEVIQDES